MRSDTSRLAELRRLLLLDSAPERAYDDAAQLLASALSVPIVLVNLLDDRRDWFKSRVGIELSESPAETSFCEIFFNTGDDFVIVGDTRLDPRFATHPLVNDAPHIRFYAGARLKSQGHTIGTLCAYDLEPRTLSADQMAQMMTLALAIMRQIERADAAAGICQEKSPVPACAGPAIV